VPTELSENMQHWDGNVLVMRCHRPFLLCSLFSNYILFAFRRSVLAHVGGAAGRCQAALAGCWEGEL